MFLLSDDDLGNGDDFDRQIQYKHLAINVNVMKDINGFLSKNPAWLN